MRIVQVGLGGWGLNWAREVLPTVPGIEVAGYADAAPAARERLAATADALPAPCFASLGEALAAVACDAVVVILPMRLHAEATREALEAGKHVLVEKPFAATLAEAQALTALAERRGRRLMVSQNYRWYPAAQGAARLVAEGELGPLAGIEIDFRRHFASTGFRFWDLAEPLLSDMSIHHYDLLRMVSGATPRRVACRGWHREGSRFTRPASAFALFELPSGATVSYRASIEAPAAPTAWSGEWAMTFARGQIAWTSRGDIGERLAAESLVLQHDGELPVPLPCPTMPHLDRAGALAAFRAFADGGDVPWCSDGRDNLASLAVMEACIRSAAAGGAWADVEDSHPAQLGGGNA